MLPLPFPASTISLAYGAVDGEYYTFSSPHQGTDFSSRSRGVTAGTVFRASGPGTVVRSGVGAADVYTSAFNVTATGFTLRRRNNGSIAQNIGASWVAVQI